MNVRSVLAGALIATASAATALAQQSGTATTTTITSEPGRASLTRTEQASATVVAIDKGTRTVKLKTPQGETVSVVASDAVKNFDQIKTGDVVVARYTNAVALKLKNTKDAAGNPNAAEGSTTTPPSERPGFTSGRRITAVDDVVAVDPKESTITLKGPDGDLVKLEVDNPDQFKVVKQGDQVEVTYTEAVAVAFEPASN